MVEIEREQCEDKEHLFQDLSPNITPSDIGNVNVKESKIRTHEPYDDSNGYYKIKPGDALSNYKVFSL